jgi:hypothetical protein
VLIDGHPSDELGRADDDAWRWQPAGQFPLSQGAVEIRIRDLTGWWGRVDALVLAGDGFQPADDPVALAAQRVKYGGVSARGERAARLRRGGRRRRTCRIGRRGGRRAPRGPRGWIQDRPVVGGNSSSEISVPPMGYLGSPPDRVNVTGLCEEFFPTPQGWNRYADSARMEAIVRAEPGIELFLNTRATGVRMVGCGGSIVEPGQPGEPGEIEAVLAIDVRTGQRSP